MAKIKTHKVSLKLIEQATAEKWIRQLAFYHILKARYNNSCIYDYRSRMNELAPVLGVSTRTLYNYLNFLKKKNLASDHATNLQLKSIKQFLTRKKAVIYIDDNYNITAVCHLLFAKLIEQKAKCQAFAEAVRRYGRGDRHISAFSAIPFRPSFSYRNIAKILNCSEYCAFTVVKNLERLKVINTEKQKPQKVTDNFTALETVEDLPGYRFNIDNRLFEVFGIKIDFLQFPVFLKPLTIQQYLNHLKRSNSI